MISSAEALALLNRWKSASAKLWFWSLAGGIQASCEGTLKHVSSGNLEFGRPEIAGSELLLVVNLDEPTFSFVDNRDASHFWPSGRKKTEFGSTLEIRLRRDAVVILAELFPGTIEVPLK